MRTIAIGDIHGCSLALATLLEEIRPAAGDTFIFMGDYIDRGPNSRNVIEQIIELSRRATVIPLLGNHEVLLLASLEQGEPNPFWLERCGGEETLISYGGELNQFPDEHAQFIRSCRRWHETATHFYIHANYYPDQPIDSQPENIALWHHLTAFLPQPHYSGKIAVVGHTPQRSGDVLNLGHLICIDTGCYAGGWLTAMNIDSGQTWQANRFGELRR